MIENEVEEKMEKLREALEKVQEAQMYVEEAREAVEECVMEFDSKVMCILEDVEHDLTTTIEQAEAILEELEKVIG